jgi:hypothetical protein
MPGRSWRPDGWAREQDGRKKSYSARESDSGGSESDGEEDEGEWGQPHLRPPYLQGGLPNLPVVVPSIVQHASTSLFREVREKIKAYFSLKYYIYDLNLSLGRQLNKKTTSSRPDGKHVLQAPTSH